MSTLAARRSHLYGLLSQAFSVTDGALPETTAGALPEDIRRAAGALAPHFVGGADVPLKGPVGILDEYSALFEVGSTGAPPISPYGGEYAGARLATMEDLLRFYRFFGLRLSLVERDRPDHLSTELEFLHWLSGRQAATEADGRDGSHYVNATRDLLREHAVPLSRALAEEVRERSGLYPELVRLVAEFCSADLALVGTCDPSDAVPVAVSGQMRRLREDGTSSTESYTLAAVRDGPLEWDAIVKGSHLANCWYQRYCNLNVYILDGLVLREEQVGNYPSPSDPTVPDPNPRGCQKGLCYAQRLYAPTRLKFPIKRLGERGEGKWRRVSWDTALNEISDTLIDVLTTEGPDVVLQAGGAQQESTAAGSGPATFSTALGGPVPLMTGDYGDDMAGVGLTAGKIVFADSADNWFHADLILIWGSNPAYTHIPNYHYLSEARYRGARVVQISPDYNASSMHADRWLPVAIGSDAALALAMAQVILREDLMRTDFVREQTDLPLLVRSDNRRLLRERDLKRGGRDDQFYMYDEATRRVVEAPRRTLALGAIKPALTGEYEVKTVTGKTRVRPVCALLREKLDAENTPEQAAKVTGVAPSAIERLARDIARAKGVVNVPGSNFGKFYHGDLIYRAMLLVFALCGQMGRKGASFNAFPALNADTAVGTAPRSAQALQAAIATDRRYAAWKQDGYTTAMITGEQIRDAVAAGALSQSSLVHFVHGGLLDQSAENQGWDPGLTRPLREYVDEAFAKGWQKVVPARGKDPRVMFQVGGNMLRRGRSTRRLLTTLLPKLKLLVTIDSRMTSTAMYSDYVLPACSWYEKFFIPGNGTPIAPFLQVNVNAMQPLYDSASDRVIFIRLARAVARRAKERGIISFKDAAGTERRFDRIVDAVTSGGLYDEEDDEALARDAYSNAANVEQMDWEELKERGIASYTGVGTATLTETNACDVVPGEPIVPLTWHVDKKEPYPTLTRRLQFYIDHDWYLEMGEQLPTHKDPPKAGGDYPLAVTSGHARWSIHSMWVDDALLLGLQRGEPVIYLNSADAVQRNVRDGDRVEVFNDVGRFEILAIVAPGVRPGQVVVYHSWENYQFRGWDHFKSVSASPLNPLELVGGYGHIRPDFWGFTPGLSDRDSRVDVRKIGEAMND